MASAVQDLKHGARLLMRSPGFSFVAILALMVLGGVTWWRARSMHNAFTARDRRGGTIAPQAAP